MVWGTSWRVVSDEQPMKQERPHTGLNRLRSGLFVKLLAAFVLVVIVSVAALALLSRRTATREFTRFIRESQVERPDAIISQLAALYGRQGDWVGAEELLGSTSAETTDQHRIPPLLLADAQGNLVASSWMQPFSDPLPEHMLANGWPVQVSGQTVGTLLAANRWPPPVPVRDGLSPEGAATVARVERTILVAGLSAGAVALVIAGVLAWSLVRPLRRLTAAAEGIAHGDLSQRVPVTSGDEVGELAATFNLMAGELERAEQLRRNMTADVAHELRTPLSVIRGRLEGVLDGVYPATPQHLQPILESTELLTYLVEDLRLLAQAEAGQLALEKRSLDIGDLLQDAQVNYEPYATDQGVALVLDPPPKLPGVLADWHRINQVLGNLVTNALRHTPRGGRVTLSARAVEGMVKVTVVDTGVGILPEDLPYVFDRFWRGEKSRSRVGGGTGLGLAIAKQLVELHGGSIGVASAPGGGSEFWFTLSAG
jgi:two-component system sensor histidine kinase BaeS